MRILVVEDTESIAHMISALVKARGHEVTSVGTGSKAVELALKETFDLVLLDINLPGTMDGFAVCKKLRTDVGMTETPVIFISAMSDDIYKKRAFEQGASAYYTKPFSPLALLKEIEAISVRTSGKFPGAHKAPSQEPSK